MEIVGCTSRRRLRQKRNADVKPLLRKSWYNLRLSVRYPERVPTWDAIVLTAASPEQADLFRWQLQRAIRNGRISASTVTLVVPDPDGIRIGSGAATLNAVRVLASHYHALELSTPEVGVRDGNGIVLGSKNSVQSIVDFVAGKCVLLIHAGGDSKRVPWANPMGKAFLPLPFLASDDPDGPVPLLFDHILAVASCARQAFKTEGGILTMTGDVLPCFDASTLVVPDHASCVVTVPVTIDVASNHGVIVASKSAKATESYSLSLVDNLLQKPNVDELIRNEAILQDGRTLLDTGVIAARGKSWTTLVSLACSSEQMISELIKSGKEVSLYEDLVAAWVPAKHRWLQARPMGNELVRMLGNQNMYSYCCYDLKFLHFGTSCEVLDQLCRDSSGLVGRRHLSSIPATTFSDISASAIILSSKIEPGVSVGDDSLIYDSSISDGVQIGSLSILVGVNFPKYTLGTSRKFMLPDRHCLWEVPLVGCAERILVYCGIHDNPKHSLSKDGTFCGIPWKKLLRDLNIHEIDLWDSEFIQEKCFWNAKIFPVLSFDGMLNMASWLIGVSDVASENVLHAWRKSKRLSLEELHKSIDYSKMCLGASNHHAELAAGIANACISYGMLSRNFSQLCEEILQSKASGVNICKGFLDCCSKLQSRNSRILPKSRLYQVQYDLLRHCADDATALQLEHQIWAAVADETASAVRYGFQEHSMGSQHTVKRPLICNRKVIVELPVRVDFVGGWSDTPPWSLERAGCVLNMSIGLDNRLPIGTIMETMEESGIEITDDVGNHCRLDDLSSLSPPFDSDDPFRLVKAALLVTGNSHSKTVGLRIQTWANVPRGSGLGTSSILAAAVVKSLLQLSGDDDSNENITRLVLVLEQLMGTGGGWQDQIGGLYPGIKFTCSFPGVPLRLQVTPLRPSSEVISELQQRLLVVFTGQVRLAHQVLHKVVTRYLRRDNLLVSSIKRLAELAKFAKEALLNNNIDELGEIMLEAWRLHQELDPFCSNYVVDKLFSFADPYCCGYKLVGAGGGGFALLLARDVASAEKLKLELEKCSDFPVKVYSWDICM